MNIIRKVFIWIFKDQLEEVQKALHQANKLNNLLQAEVSKVQNILQNIDVSVDVHHYSPSWAVISIQGERTDYIKFVDLGHSDMIAISHFLRQFERGKIDANPAQSRALRPGLWRIDNRRY